jgi:hypothetical protein
LPIKLPSYKAPQGESPLCSSSAAENPAPQGNFFPKQWVKLAFAYPNYLRKTESKDLYLAPPPPPPPGRLCRGLASPRAAPTGDREILPLASPRTAALGDWLVVRHATATQAMVGDPRDVPLSVVACLVCATCLCVKAPKSLKSPKARFGRFGCVAQYTQVVRLFCHVHYQ